MGACREVFTHCHGSIFNMLKTDVTSRVLQEADREMEHTGCLLRALFNHQYLCCGRERKEVGVGRGASGCKTGLVTASTVTP